MATPLILKRAPIGDDQDDYDVLENGGVVGRIFTVPTAPEGRPWMWASGHSADSVKRAAHGYEPTREAAMAAFAKSRRRERNLARARARLYPEADFRVSCQLRRVGCPCAQHHSLRSSTASLSARSCRRDRQQRWDR